MPLDLGLQRRLLLPVAVCALAQTILVLGVAATQPTAGGLAVAAAVVLGVVAVAAAAAAGARLAAGWFPVATAACVVLLPLLGNRFVLAPDRADYDRRALPALVGTQATGAFALGVLGIVLVAVLPELAVGALGVVVVVVALVVWSPGALGGVRPMLHEHAYSVALPEWLVVATIVAALLRRPLLGLGLGGLAVATILRAAHEPFAAAGFWRGLGPLAPAGGVLLASLWLLVPRLRSAARPTPAEQ
jgi:hypothetical protein